MAVTVYYHDDADPSIIRGKKVAVDRLRLAGPCPRAEPQGLGHRRCRRPARGVVVGCQGRSGRPECDVDRRGCRLGRCDHAARPRHRAEADLRRAHRTQPRRRQGAGVRPRVQRALRPYPGAGGCRRDHDRPEGPGPPRATYVHRGRRRAGADRGRTGRHRQGPGDRHVVRRCDRCDTRRCHRNDVRRRDRDRPVRRAGRAVRRIDGARAGRLRDAHRGRAMRPRWPTSSACTR